MQAGSAQAVRENGGHHQVLTPTAQLKQEPRDTAAAGSLTAPAQPFAAQQAVEAKSAVQSDPDSQLQPGSARMDADSTANGAQHGEPGPAGQPQPGSARMDADSIAAGVQQGEPDVRGQSKRPKRQRSSVDYNQDHIAPALAAEEQRAAKRRAKAVPPCPGFADTLLSHNVFHDRFTSG